MTIPFSQHTVCMASQANSTLRVHFHDTVNINILPPIQQTLDARCNEPLPEPYINIPFGFPNHNASSSAPDNSHSTVFHQVFLKSKPRFRGVTQIFVAHFQLALGIALNFVGGNIYTMYTYIIYWGPPFLICSGILAVTAHNIISSKLVRACNIFHTISILIIASGLVLSCVDIFMIYPCGIMCANLGTMAIASFVVMTNLLQLSLSSYIVYFGFRSLKYMSETPPQTRGNENLGFVLPDPPAYSEEPFHAPPPFPHPPPCPPPPPYTNLSPAYSPPAFSEVPDSSQPPPYSE